MGNTDDMHRHSLKAPLQPDDHPQYHKTWIEEEPTGWAGCWGMGLLLGCAESTYVERDLTSEQDVSAATLAYLKLRGTAVGRRNRFTFLAAVLGVGCTIASFVLSTLAVHSPSISDTLNLATSIITSVGGVVTGFFLAFASYFEKSAKAIDADMRSITPPDVLIDNIPASFSVSTKAMVLRAKRPDDDQSLDQSIDLSNDQTTYSQKQTVAAVVQSEVKMTSGPEKATPLLGQNV